MPRSWVSDDSFICAAFISVEFVAHSYCGLQDAFIGAACLVHCRETERERKKQRERTPFCYWVRDDSFICAACLVHLVRLRERERGERQRERERGKKKRNKNIYIYIFIFTNREREREQNRKREKNKRERKGRER